jgi:opacity protein-like surface antigen
MKKYFTARDINYEEEYSAMRKIFQYLIVAALLVAGFSTSASAAGFYIGLLGGGSFVPDATASDVDGSANFSFDGGFDGSVSLGYDLGTENPNVGKGRVEFEFNTASNDIKQAEFVEGGVEASGSADRTSIMLNTIGEYKTRSGMIIYALLGLGWAKISLDNIAILGVPFVDDSDSSLLAYQAGLGVGWELSQHFFFDIGYRYYGTTDPEFSKQDGNSLDYEYTSHRVLAGVRLHF